MDMKKKLFALTLLGAATLAAAQAEPPCADPDSSDLRFCTLPASEGLSAVNIGGQWGFVGLDGRMRIAPQFDGAGRFSQGRAPARKHGRWGYIDKEGKWLIEPRFHAATEFSEDRAIAKDEQGRWQLIDPDGTALAPLPAGATPLSEEAWQTSRMLRGQALVQLPAQRELVTLQGRIPVPADAQVTDSPKDGLVLAARQTDEGSRYGFLDTRGHWAIEPRFEQARSFLQGHAAVRTGGQWQLIDARGKTARRLDADDVDRVLSYWVVRTGKAAVLLHPDGRPAAPSSAARFEKAFAALDDDILDHYTIAPMLPLHAGMPLALLTPKEGVDRPLGLMDAEGKIHFNPEWLSFRHDPHWVTELPLAVETLGGIGAVDGQGRWVVQPVLDELSPFQNGKAALILGENHGLASADGTLLLPPPGTRWEHVTEDERASFRRGRAVGVLHARTGEVLWSAEGDLDFVPRGGQTYSVEVDDRLGVKNAQGAWLLEPQCEELEHLDSDVWMCSKERRDYRSRVLVDARGRQTPVFGIEKLGAAGATWLLFAEDRSGVLFAGHEPLWFDEVLWEPGDTIGEPIVEFGDALLHARPVKRYALVDAQGSTLSTHEAVYVVRSERWPDRVLLQQRGSARRIAAGAENTLPGYLAGSVAAGDVTVIENGDGYRTFIHPVDGAARSEIEGWWRPASRRWLVGEEARRDQGALVLRDAATGARRSLPYAEARAAGEGVIAVRDADGLWGWVNDQLKTVAGPRYADVGWFSEGVVWVRSEAALELLDASGKRLGRVNYECERARWVPGAGTARDQTAGC